ncbi:MAG: zinc/manganese transport system substrate-binding protein [Bradymonadia bacterium]
MFIITAMKLLTLPLIFLALLLPAAASANLRVVATLPDLGAIAQEVGAGHLDVTVLASHSEDPHYVDARPSHLVSLGRADIVIANGNDLEVGWLPSLLVQSRNAGVQPGSRGYIEATALVSTLLHQSAETSRSHGDVHAGGNPHVTHDPRAVREIALALGALFAELDPAHAGHYEARAAAFAREIDVFIAEQVARFGALTQDQRRVVCYHDSLPYLLDWLGIEMLATLEPLPGVPPTPAHVAQVVTAMRAEGVRAIVHEEHYPRSTTERVADIAGARVFLFSGGTNVNAGERYVEHLRHVANGIYGALAP